MELHLKYLYVNRMYYSIYGSGINKGYTMVL